jgi:Ca2+-binding RTX toxin-like protein
MATIRVRSNGFGYGTKNNDKIYGDGKDNDIYGYGGNDRIYGAAGDDYLEGNNGRDTLTGGAGSDSFYFGHLNPMPEIDVITDYSNKYDAILLANDVFRGIGSAEKWMKASAFWQGTKAHDTSDRIIYNSKDGLIYYDPDGTGSKEATPFVKVGAGRKMSATDFWVVDY